MGGVGLEWDGEKDPSFQGDIWRGVDTKPQKAAIPSPFPASNLYAASKCLCLSSGVSLWIVSLFRPAVSCFKLFS